MSLNRRFMGPGRSWPKIDVGNGPIRGDIKALSLERLEALMSTAERQPWSATGRPEWVSERRPDLSHAILVVFGVESPSVYRCLAVVFTITGDGWAFTLDVSFNSFDSLPDISRSELTRLTQSLLYRFPMVPLDQGQEESWQ
jgi:hypothetical protein